MPLDLPGVDILCTHCDDNHVCLYSPPPYDLDAKHLHPPPNLSEQKSEINPGPFPVPTCTCRNCNFIMLQGDSIFNLVLFPGPTIRDFAC